MCTVSLSYFRLHCCVAFRPRHICQRRRLQHLANLLEFRVALCLAGVDMLFPSTTADDIDVNGIDEPINDAFGEGIVGFPIKFSDTYVCLLERNDLGEVEDGFGIVADLDEGRSEHCTRQNSGLLF